MIQNRRKNKMRYFCCFFFGCFTFLCLNKISLHKEEIFHSFCPKHFQFASRLWSD